MQLPPPLPTPAINEPDSVIPGGACPREVREPSFSGQDQRSQHGHNEHIPTDGPFDGQQGRDVCNTPPQAPEKSREHAGVPGSQGIVCSNAHGAHLSPGTAARGHMHCQQVAGHQNEPHVHAAVEHGPEAPDTPEQHAGGGSPVIEGPQRHESAQRESGPGVAALEHQLADVRISHQRESADGGERKHRLWEGALTSICRTHTSAQGSHRNCYVKRRRCGGIDVAVQTIAGIPQRHTPRRKHTWQARTSLTKNRKCPGKSIGTFCSIFSAHVPVAFYNLRSRG